MRYKGKYSLNENLLKGRGMRLLKEAYELPDDGLFKGQMKKTGQVKRLISGGLAELLAHVALGVAIPADVASFAFASSGAKDITVDGKEYEVKMNSAMPTPKMPEETNVEGDELAEKGENEVVVETASGSFFVEITKYGKNGTKDFKSVREAWGDAGGTGNLGAAQKAAEKALKALGKTKQDVVNSYTQNVDGIIVVNKGIEMQKKMEEMFAAKDPTLMAAIKAEDYGAVVTTIAKAVGAVAAIVDVNGASSSGAFSGYGDNPRRIGLNASGSGRLHRF